MILDIWQLLYLYLIGLALALLEIEIEGPNGWAKNLPTKKIKMWWSKRLGKELTGYHVSLQIFLLLIIHLPLVFEKRFTLEMEILIITQYLFFIVYWDFLWFVLNPNFKLKSFKKGGVPWHKSWAFGMPSEYWWAIIIAVFLPAMFWGVNVIMQQLIYLMMYLGFTVVTILVYALFFRKKL